MVFECPGQRPQRPAAESEDRQRALVVWTARGGLRLREWRCPCPWRREASDGWREAYRPSHEI